MHHNVINREYVNNLEYINYSYIKKERFLSCIS